MTVAAWHKAHTSCDVICTGLNTISCKEGNETWSFILPDRLTQLPRRNWKNRAAINGSCYSHCKVLHKQQPQKQFFGMCIVRSLFVQLKIADSFYSSCQWTAAVGTERAAGSSWSHYTTNVIETRHNFTKWLLYLWQEFSGSGYCVKELNLLLRPNIRHRQYESSWYNSLNVHCDTF
jgi:hypothetical protein